MALGGIYKNPGIVDNPVVSSFFSASCVPLAPFSLAAAVTSSVAVSEVPLDAGVTSSTVGLEIRTINPKPT